MNIKMHIKKIPIGKNNELKAPVIPANTNPKDPKNTNNKVNSRHPGAKQISNTVMLIITNNTKIIKT